MCYLSKFKVNENIPTLLLHNNIPIYSPASTDFFYLSVCAVEISVVIICIMKNLIDTALHYTVLNPQNSSIPITNHISYILYTLIVLCNYFTYFIRTISNNFFYF